ncbi:MAG: PLDc N-terminal domain-containing protein [bacterium]|nr:PLDc N-terminal domain-containing protein [bacterium]
MILFFQLLSFLTIIASFALVFAALRHLNRQPITGKDFWVWALIVFFMPIIGSIMVFVYFDKPRYK